MPIPFRILDNRPVYLDQLGRPVKEGALRFYEAGTLNPKNVYSGPDLSVSNGPVVALDSAGRTEVDTWGNGAYRVRLYDVAGVLVSEADDVQVPGGAAAAIPTPEDGKFLSAIGGVMVWDSVRQVPDPTGQNGKTLQSDGLNAIWVAVAAATANGIITITANSIKWSNGTSAIMAQWGSDTVPATGTPVANKAFSFPTAFTALLHVEASINGGPAVANPVGGIPSFGVGGRSAAGAVMNLDTNAFGSTVNIVNPVPFSWFAIGTVAP